MHFSSILAKFIRASSNICLPALDVALKNIDQQQSDLRNNLLMPGGPPRLLDDLLRVIVLIQPTGVPGKMTASGTNQLYNKTCSFGS